MRWIDLVVVRRWAALQNPLELLQFCVGTKIIDFLLNFDCGRELGALHFRNVVTPLALLLECCRWVTANKFNVFHSRELELVNIFWKLFAFRLR